MSKQNIFWITASVVIVLVFALPLVSTDYLDSTTTFIEANPAIAPFVIVPMRFLGVVLAPLPGAPVAFASMAVLPWWQAWAYNALGAEVGAIVAFLIARRFREPAVRHIAPLGKIHEWQERISERKQFWSFVGLRISALFAFDFVSYAAGLSRIRFGHYLAATLLIDIPVGFLFFFFGGIAVRYSIYLFLVSIGVFILALLLWRFVLRDKVVHK